MVYKLMKGAKPEEIRRAGLGGYYAIWDKGIFPSDSNGVPWTSAYINVMGDPIADLHEDMAAEQKARATYENLINLTDDPDLADGLKFLREREVVHFQRFGETLDHLQGYMNGKKFY
ncbi:MAG: manganese catalase family protein, partial [Syntrophaceticus sp.]